jgi:adenosylhomocysteine nucleosidase
VITGIVVALPQELTTLTKTNRKIVKGGFVTLSESLLLAYSGAGANNAHAAAELLIAQGATRLISWGCAAALSPSLQSGNLVLADNLITADGDTLTIDSHWFRHVKTGLEKLALNNAFALRTGDLLESKTLVAKSLEKQQLYQQSKAVALDMESVAIAKVAQARSLPFLAIRAIADPVSMDLPEAVRVALNDQGDVDMGKLIRFFLTHPSEIKGLCALGQQFNAAKNTLTSVGNALPTVL